jgi:hypothetical protein
MSGGHFDYQMKNKMNEKLAEEIEKMANEYAEKHGFRVPYDGSNNFYDDVDVKASKEGFIEGARWMNKMLFPNLKTKIPEDEIELAMKGGEE